MYKLVIWQKNSPPLEYPIKKENILIGRSSESDVILSDISVSRKHARITVAGDVFKVIDLASKNGVYLNGRRIEQASFEPGDEITIGDSILKVLSSQEGKLIFAQDETSEFSIDRAIIRSPKAISEAEGLGIAHVSKEREYLEWRKKDVKGYDLEFLQKRNFQLHRFIRMLNSVADLDKLLEMCLDEIMMMVNAERGFLILRDSETGELVPHVIRTSGDAIAVSKTVINKVLQENVSILSSDAQHDERFDRASSLRLHEIKSIICAPLWIENDVMGVIHIDNSSQTNFFTEDDLALVSLLSNYAAISIRKHELNQKNIELIDKLEQKVRERTNELELSIAKIKEQNEQLEKMNILKTKLFHILNHDIRTPLSTIVGFVELLYSEKIGPMNEKQRDYINKVLQNTLKISKLIDNVTRFGKLSSRETALQKKKILFKSWAIDTIKPFTDNSKKIKIEVEADDSILINADIIIEQVLINLVENSIKFGKENGRVLITIAEDEHFHTINVWDNGRGIPEDQFDKIFDQFYKIDKKVTGTGLGLAIAKYIVEIHGGEIKVGSKVGQYTKISFTLPKD